jgi:hypothetical protein
MAIRVSAAVNRILSVFIGFVLALIGGGITLFFVGSRWAAQEVAAQMADDSGEVPHFLSEAVGMVSFLFTVAPVLTLAPAVVAVVVGELARIRSLLYYVLAGGAAAAAMPLIAAPYEAAQNTTYNAPYFSIMATAGFAAGLIYWLFAGRRA